ncbi:hypothetical protein C1J03_12235 [Sulfitobacter sp. SK012]|uniref:hypothetical protein n=1 Tax=Sulfitobacter sp. SK012 TaxID=1389005 RepID=UPI000E0A4C47|nr:hypothetical protein [Sulfitobacter sp. SK012]AXI46721.1 hypothetical protein C1J03_12235 [Sulfitobacter sp. SK012]
MAAGNRVSRNAPTVDIIALKYIRIVLASYILAIGLGLINGFDANAYFSGFLSHPTSLYVSKVFVSFCALMLFFGFFLRLVSLSLAIVILASSIQVNLIVPIQGSVDAFWADLVLICGLLACYCPLSARQLSKQAVVKSGPSTSAAPKGNGQKIAPRRVTTSQTTGANLGSLPKAVQRPVLAAYPSKQQDALMERFASLVPPQRPAKDDVINIFA